MKRNLDNFVRIIATLINTIGFGLILWYKFVYYNQSISYLLTYITIFFSSLIYFFVFYNSIKDKRGKFKPHISNETKNCNPNEIIVGFNIIEALKNIKVDESIRTKIKDRVTKSIDLMGKEETIKNLIAQHRLCSDNERFYEQIAWQIGAIFVPVSLTLASLSLTKQVLNPYISVACGFMLFLTWVFLFGRFRSSIRLYRECSQLIEDILGMFAVSYVYDYCFDKYGKVVRVWAFLVILTGLYFNFAVFMLF
jgi:hypothetical protein